MSCMIVTAFLFLESRVMSSRVGGLRVFYYIYTCKGCKQGSTGLRGEGFDLCEWVFSSRMFFLLAGPEVFSLFAGQWAMFGLKLFM
jgi:hypothetical protein